MDKLQKISKKVYNYQIDMCYYDSYYNGLQDFLLYNGTILTKQQIESITNELVSIKLYIKKLQKKIQKRLKKRDFWLSEKYYYTSIFNSKTNQL